VTVARVLEGSATCRLERAQKAASIASDQWKGTHKKDGQRRRQTAESNQGAAKIEHSGGEGCRSVLDASKGWGQWSRRGLESKRRALERQPRGRACNSHLEELRARACNSHFQDLEH